ncbi:hypothetical protein CYMTET_27087 [Cymbomonas tetramitiformis]|uniref:Proline dehydrogenase n=1 Tax=Cymbomonas tetramitiformis TaxID=36881 RepID=A0AAE0KX96_9CHLO|nr:hypothetical protein CYMTET_27087 [Cymbomonas tetramitiformis]
MAQHALPSDDPYVHHAQIMGMCDNITFGLALSGHNALKLVTFGKFEEVLPWLLRRLQENQGPNPDHGEEPRWEEVERLALVDRTWEAALEETGYVTQCGQGGHGGGTQGSWGTQPGQPGQACGGVGEAERRASRHLESMEGVWQEAENLRAVEG